MGAALTASMGELVLLLDDLSSPVAPGARQEDAGMAYRAELDKLLRLRRRCPALCAGGARQQVATSDDARFYAFLRGSTGGERALAVFNFQPTAQRVTVDLAGQQVTALENLDSGETLTLAEPTLSLDLPAYGYAFYRV